MNNQPKFKKGDRVRVNAARHPMHEEEGIVIAVRKNGVLRVKFDKGEIGLMYDYQVAPYSPTPDMLAIPDDHVWPETSGNEVVIVDELFEKQKESFIKAATSMTGSATLTPEFKALGEFSTKLDSVDQELEDVANNYAGSIVEKIDPDGISLSSLDLALAVKFGANWKAEQSANDAIEFMRWTRSQSCGYIIGGKDRNRKLNSSDYITDKELYELWQENQKKSITL